MAPLFQIAAGGTLVIFCTILHIYSFTFIVHRFRRWQKRHNHWITRSESRRIILVLMVLLASHTVQVYIWALTFWAGGMLDGVEPSIYFALASYTTLGYGDVTLAPDYRIYGAMSSVVGLFTIGMSTAFLVSFFSELLAHAKRRD